MMRTWKAAILLTVMATTLQAQDWDRTISAGLNLTRGNSDTMVTTAGFQAQKSGTPHEQRYSVTANYGETDIDGDNEKTVGNANAKAEYKYKFNGSYVYANNSLLHDSVADIDYRLIAGGGGGYYLLQTDAAKLGVELGVAYIREERANDPGDDSIALRLAARHDQTLGDTAKLWAAIEYLPTADDFDLYLLNSEVGAEAILNTSLNLRVVLLHRHDSDVQGTRDRNDVSLISSLVYKL